MHIKPTFKPIADVDKTCKEYVEFFNALQLVDWTQSESIKGSNTPLGYAPGFVFSNIPWVNEHPGFKKVWGSEEPLTPEIEKVKTLSVNFFEYIESIIPNHKIIRAEMMATQPENKDQIDELSRMHYDNKIFHRHAKRCQLAFFTNPGCFLFVENEALNLSTDTIYEFNNRLCHWGVNWGDTLKLVLVFDAIDVDVWNRLSRIVKDNFFNEEPTSLDLHRCNKFKERFRLAPPPGIEPGSRR